MKNFVQALWQTSGSLVDISFGNDLGLETS